MSAVRYNIRQVRQWRPWFTLRFYGGPLDGVTRRTWRGGRVWLGSAGELIDSGRGDCYWLLHEVEEDKNVHYGWDPEYGEDEEVCPCCGTTVPA